jgi:hypothetical protein
MGANPFYEYDFGLEGDVGDDTPFIASDIEVNRFARYVIRSWESFLHVNQRSPGAVFQDRRPDEHRLSRGGMKRLVDGARYLREPLTGD